MREPTEPTITLTEPNWRWTDGRVGFAERLRIYQPADEWDEPTIPRGLIELELELEEA